jgi:hypothetical protein
VNWIAGQRLEWLDRFELGRQKRALMKVEVADRLGTRRLWHARGRKPQGGANIWHKHHLAIRSLEAGRQLMLAHEFTLVHGTVPSAPRCLVVDAARLFRAAQCRRLLPRSEETWQRSGQSWSLAEV